MKKLIEIKWGIKLHYFSVGEHYACEFFDKKNMAIERAKNFYLYLEPKVVKVKITEM